MTERAQALEAALKRLEGRSIMLPDFSGEAYDAELVLSVLREAVQPPPPVGSPTTEQIREFKVYICDDCLHLRGEMCHEPGCRFCRRTMAEVAEYLDVLLIRPIINGVGVIVDRGEHL